MVFPALRTGMQATTNALNNTAQMAQASQALQAQQNMQPMVSLNPYGYGTAPNSSNRGYFEQQTPVGSFAAADQQRANAFTANANQATNPYIGQTSAGISGQSSVMPYAQQAAQNAMRDNPYLGMTTGTASAAQNSMAGLNNPYLTQAIDAASSDAARNYNMAIAPQRDRQMQQSGSFGNTGVQQMQLEDQRNFGQTLGNIANSARMADYNQQVGLAENLANRQTGISQFNSGLNAADIGRNLGGFFTGQGLGLQGMGQLLGAAQFDASLGNNVNQFNSTLGANDLARNAQLAQNLGQFNAGALNNMNQFNASAMNNMGQFNAGQGNAMNLANAQAANNMLSQYRNLTEQGRQFDESLDYNIYRGNAQDARNANQDYLNFLQSMAGMNSGAYNMAGNAYQMPMQYLNQFGNLGATIGGMGGTTSQNMSGNPYMGLIGGYMIGNQIFNPNQRGGN